MLDQFAEEAVKRSLAQYGVEMVSAGSPPWSAEHDMRQTAEV
jgi:hypothetical protein